MIQMKKKTPKYLENAEMRRKKNSNQPRIEFLLRKVVYFRGINLNIPHDK